MDPRITQEKQGCSTYTYSKPLKALTLISTGQGEVSASADNRHRRCGWTTSSFALLELHFRSMNFLCVLEFGALQH